MKTRTRLALTMAMLLAAAPLLSACYTTRGAGEDLSAAGNGIAHAAGKDAPYKP